MIDSSESQIYENERQIINNTQSTPKNFDELSKNIISFITEEFQTNCDSEG